ncbi:MAG: PHP-associated domain-containing protein [Promethearchaeota archaeon]
MVNQSHLHQSVSRIKPSRLAQVRIPKQSNLADLFFGRLLKRFGITQILTYHKIRKRNPKMVYPYMPKKFPEDAYLYDFHFHSYYSDGRGSFRDILNEISLKKHLNGLTITDHPYHLGKDLNDKIPSERVIKQSFQFQKLIENYKRKGKLTLDFISFPGSCEFFCKLNDHSDAEIELILLGVSKDFVQRNGGVKKLTNLCHAVELIEKVHDDNGLVIVPHPFFFTSAHKLLRYKLSRYSRPDAVEAINYTTGFISDKAYYPFLEQLPFSDQTKTIAHNFGYFNWMTTIVTQKNNYGKYFDYPLARKIGAVGSSDAHFFTMIGAASTLIKEQIHSIEDLRRVFHKKQTQPIYNPLWSINTEKKDVYKEIWDAYGTYVNEGITKHSFFQWILAKTIVDITSFFFD